MLIVVVLLFILCWGPTIIIDMLIGLGKQRFTQEFYVFKWVSSLLPFLHCCINPIIYSFMSKNFRKSMIRVLTGPCRPCIRRCCGANSLRRKAYFSRAATTRMSSSFVHDVTSGHTDLETITALWKKKANHLNILKWVNKIQSQKLGQFLIQIFLLCSNIFVLHKRAIKKKRLFIENFYLWIDYFYFFMLFR